MASGEETNWKVQLRWTGKYVFLFFSSLNSVFRHAGGSGEEDIQKAVLNFMNTYETSHNC